MGFEQRIFEATAMPTVPLYCFIASFTETILGFLLFFIFIISIKRCFKMLRYGIRLKTS